MGITRFIESKIERHFLGFDWMNAFIQIGTELHQGVFTATLLQYSQDRDYSLSRKDHVKPGDLCLQLAIPYNHPYISSFSQVREPLSQFAVFVEENPQIAWILCPSWLGSIRNGKLIERFGFHVSDSNLSPSYADAVRRAAYKPDTPTNKRYAERVAKAKIRPIYASRHEFLSHYLRRAR